MAKIRKIAFPSLFALSAAVLLTAGCRAGPTPEDYILNDIPELTGEAPKNVILVIGDGMGSEHLRAGGFYANGIEGSLSFEDSALFSVVADMGTRNVWGAVTDSAASATAMATGRKVFNGILSMESLCGESLETLAEAARSQGKSIGLVTTDYFWGATPAAFAVHHNYRYDADEVIEQLLGFRPEVLFGGGKGVDDAVIDAAAGAGYETVSDSAELSDVIANSSGPVFGHFGDSYMPYAENLGSLPTLDDMALAALARLEKDSDGFFLLVENELTDEASHGNDEAHMVKEVAALDTAVEAILGWASDRTDTLIVVTADHETGGLEVLLNNGAGEIPEVSWATGGHTSRDVKLFAHGVDAETFSLVLENVDIHRIMIRYY